MIIDLRCVGFIIVLLCSIFVVISKTLSFVVIFYIVIIIMLLLILIPIIITFYIWIKYGKDYFPKEVGYLDKYERDLPSKDDPITANYFIKGIYTNNWFSTAIMYLAWKKHLKLVKEEDDFYILKGIEPKKLSRTMSHVYTYIIQMLGDKKKLSVNKIKTELIYDERFTTLSIAVKGSAEHKFKIMNVLGREGKDKYYDFSFLWVAGLFSLIIVGSLMGCILEVILGIAFEISVSSVFWYIIIGCIIGIVTYAITLIIIGIVSKGAIGEFFCKWTREGRVLNLKWNNFKRYITNFSLMKEHPPRSVEMWREYMVYATAFGVAKKTAKVLKAIAPDLANDNNFVTYTAFSAAYNATSFKPSVRVGRIGGRVGAK